MAGALYAGVGDIVLFIRTKICKISVSIEYLYIGGVLYIGMLVDKRILAGGGALLVAGMVITAVLGSNMPVGESGMTEDEVLTLLEQQRENEDFRVLAGMMVGVGFLLILVSFGVRRKRGSRKKTKDPST